MRCLLLLCVVVRCCLLFVECNVLCAVEVRRSPLRVMCCCLLLLAGKLCRVALACVVCYWLFVVCCVLFVVRCLLCVVCCLFGVCCGVC